MKNCTDIYNFTEEEADAYCNQLNDNKKRIEFRLILITLRNEVAFVDNHLLNDFENFIKGKHRSKKNLIDAENNVLKYIKENYRIKSTDENLLIEEITSFIESYK